MNARLMFGLLLGVCLPLAGGCGSNTSPGNADDASADVEGETTPFRFDDSQPAPPRQQAEGAVAETPPPSKDPVQFVDVAQQVGIDHTYVNGEKGQLLMMESTGGGCGWGDFDADGRWDLFLNQGGDYTRPAARGQPSDALFLQRGGRFIDATGASRMAGYGYGQGVAVGDFDNDGFDDVYVTNYLENTLWRNLGDGTFVEVSMAAGVSDPRWSSSAAWADIDADGDLDLYVNNYLQFDIDSDGCATPDGEPRTCHPRDFEAWPDAFFLNQGDGTFQAVAAARGLAGPGNKALSVAVADFSNDGSPDIYVANDTEPNFMFVNRGDGFFQEDAALLGCAVSRNGHKQASMGLAVADVDRNGWLDIYISHYENESNTLYQGLGEIGYEDATAQVGLHFPTLPMLGFGVVASDFNFDGHHEILVGNGHIQNYPGNPHLRMRPQLLMKDAAGQWSDRSDTAGEFFQGKRIARGMARCDFDEDGDLDVALVHQNAPVALLRNDSIRGHWLKLQFQGYKSNRRGIGCRATVRFGDTELMEELIGGGSYASSEQPVLTFGLGPHEATCEVEVRWPDGKVQRLSDVEINQHLVIHEPERP